MKIVKKRQLSTGRVFHAEAWSSQERPFTAISVSVGHHIAYGGKWAATVAVTLFNRGIQLSSYWREPR